MLRRYQGNGGVMLRKAASRLLNAIILLIIIFVSFPTIGFFVFVWIGEATSWYRAENYITMSDH